jgi:hypothetical protein
MKPPARGPVPASALLVALLTALLSSGTFLLCASPPLGAQDPDDGDASQDRDKEDDSNDDAKDDNKGKDADKEKPAVSDSDVRGFTRELKGLIQAQNVVDIEDFIVKMGELDDPRAAVLIPPAAVRLPSERNYKRALTAIKGLENEKAVAALAEHVRKTKAQYQESVLVLEAFGFRRDPASLQSIVDNIDNSIVHVRVAAIRAAAARRAKEPVAPLLDVLKKYESQRDITWLEARESLLAITGQDFDDVGDWIKWWEGTKDGFDPATIGKQSGKTKVEVKKRPDAVEFFGEEIFSRNVLFVVDVSGSMAMYDEGDYRGRNVEEDRQRLRRSKEQLTKVLKLLPKSAKFNLIAFSDKVTPWQKSLRPASPASVGSALKFVNDFLAVGATHTDEAIEMAFTDASVDTIVLLSDGAPMKREQRDPMPLIEKILQRVKDLNSSRKVRINTFGFEGVGQWPEKVPGQPSGPRPTPTPQDVEAFVKFMKALAQENRGVYRAIN